MYRLMLLDTWFKIKQERAMVSPRLQVILVVTILIAGCATPSPSRSMTTLPGQSIANYVLQRDASQTVAILDSAADNTCKQRKIVNTETIDYPKNPSKDSWTERWTVDRCGTLIYYKMGFTPSTRGGTDFSVSVWK